MKKLFALSVLVFSIAAFGKAPLIQCDAKVPGYQRFRILQSFENQHSPNLHLFLIQGGVMGHWNVRGMNEGSDENFTRTKFMMNENEFAVLSMPNEIFNGEFNQNFESSLEMMSGKFPATCFTVQ